VVRIHQRAPILTPLRALLRPGVTASLLAAFTLLLYGFDFDLAPLTADERVFVQQARTVPQSTPLFFHVADARWLQPVAVYATAATDAVFGDDSSGRLASVAVGALNVALTFVAARLLFERQWIPLLTAVLLIATPAHWWLARTGTDAIFPVPFVLAWLIGMLRFLRSDSPLALAGAGLALGAGAYTHQTAPLTMSWLFVMTVVALLAARRTPIRNFAALGAAFVIALAPLAIWFAMHPDTYPDTFGRWAVLKAHLRYPLDGLRAQINWNTLSNRTTLFWGLVDPSFLFFAGKDARLAPFLIAVALLVPLGVLRLVQSPDIAKRTLLLSAFLVPPLIASTFGVAQDLSSVAVLTAALALLAGAGLESLPTRHAAWTWLATLLAFASVYQLRALF
jgi:hypothetical protein